MLKIKICGLSRPEDIEYVNVCKPDYIGFVFAKSKRQITFEQAKKLSDNLDTSIAAVGVFVNEEITNIKKLCENRTIDLIQLHGNENEAYIDKLKNVCNKQIIKAFKVNSKQDILAAEKSSADYILLDNGAGGTGEKFDWSLINKINKPYFLAGGINTTNLDEAILKKPFCVDVSSGAETDGIKDKNKIFDIVKKFKNYK